MTPQQIEAMKMALDLATMHHTDDGYAALRAKVRCASKEALAQPEQEPVAWLDPWTQNNVTTDYDAYGKHGIPLYTTPPQRKWVGAGDLENSNAYLTPPQPEQEPVAWADRVAWNKKVRDNLDSLLAQAGFQTDSSIRNSLGFLNFDAPPQRKPDYKEFMEWASSKGYDTAYTVNSDTGEFIALNPQTADLWKAWQAAHGIKENT